jgi:hypothetical protein
MNPRSRIGVDDDVSGYRTLRRTLAVAACGALAATATACNDDPETLPAVVPTVSYAQAVPSAAPPALAAIPSCADLATAVNGVVPDMSKMSETPSDRPRWITVQAQCVFTGTLPGGGAEGQLNLVYGRYSDESGGRKADDVARIPVSAGVEGLCTGTARKLAGPYAAALSCTNESGQVRTGVGFVDGGNFVVADLHLRGSDGDRAAVEKDARQIATNVLQHLA